MTVESVRNIAETPAVLLKKKLENIKVPQFPYGVGADAFLGASDRIDSSILSMVTERRPDGYLVGVGVGGLLTFLNCFPSDIKPKGIIALDINPQVVIGGMFMIEELKRSSSVHEFIKGFFKIENDAYLEISNNLEKRDKRLERIMRSFRKSLKKEGSLDFWIPISPSHIHRFLSRDDYESTDVIQISKLIYDSIVTNFDLLKELAESGRFAVEYGDLADSRVTRSISELPGFKSSRNIVYVSNVAEMSFIPRGKEILEYLNRSLEYLSGSEKQSIFIDSMSSLDESICGYVPVRVIDEKPVYLNTMFGE